MRTSRTANCKIPFSRIARPETVSAILRFLRKHSDVARVARVRNYQQRLEPVTILRRIQGGYVGLGTRGAGLKFALIWLAFNQVLSGKRTRGVYSAVDESSGQ